MAQFNITQSLFGFTPADVQRQLDQQGFERDLAMAQNPVAGFGTMGLQSLRRGTQTLQQGLFGVEPPEMAEANALERAKQAALPALQSGGQLAYLDALAGELERMGLTNQAVQARMLADQQRATAADQQSQIALRRAQEQKAMRPTVTQPRAPIVTDLGDRVRIEYPDTGEVKFERKGATPASVAADERRRAGAEINPGYDKFGRYTNRFGEVFSNTEMAKKRTEIEELEKIADNLNKISGEDVTAAESMVDYTSGEVSKTVGGVLSPRTKDAQTRIAASKILKQMESLPPGAASDADMRTAASTFPGFSDAEGLARWVNDTKELIQNILDRYQERYDIKPKVAFTPPIELNGQRTRRGQGNRAIPAPTTGVPAGIDPADWAYMSEEDKALWR